MFEKLREEKKVIERNEVKKKGERLVQQAVNGCALGGTVGDGGLRRGAVN